MGCLDLEFRALSANLTESAAWLGVPFLSTEFVLQWKVWWMLARSPSSPSTLAIKSMDLTIGGVNSAHYTGDFAYTNLESTSYWQVNLDGLKLNGAAVGTTPYAIVDSGTSLLAGPTTDVKSIAASLSLSTTILSSKEYTVDCSATY